MKTKNYLSIIFLMLIPFIGEAQWTKVHTKQAICFTSVGTTLIAGTPNSIDISTDDGLTWTNKLSTGSNVNSIISLGDKVLAGTFVGTNSGGIYLSNDQGKTWIPVNNGLPKSDFIFSLAIKGNKIFAGTQSNGLYISSNDGTSWSKMGSPTLTNKLIQCLLVSDNSIYAGTENGIFLSTDEGTTWKNIGFTGYTALTLKMNGTTLYASIRNKGIYKSKDNGANWTIINQGLPAQPECNDFVFSGNAIFINSDGRVYMSTDEGSNWNSVSEGIFTYSGIISLHKHNTKLYGGSMDIKGNNTPNYVGTWSRSISEMTTGIKKYELSNINLYPNPSNGVINIENVNNAEYKIEIVNTLGQNIYQQTITTTTTTIHLNNLGNEGIYFVNVYDDHSNLIDVKKIVLQ